MAFAGPMASLVPTGTVLAFAGTVAPVGFLLCDGSAVSRTVYSNLFQAVGPIHGTGDGSTTFNLPDYRGRFLRGFDPTAARDTDASTRTALNTGGATGNALGTLQADGMRSHTHQMYSPGGGNYGSTGTHSFYWGGGGGPINQVSQPHNDTSGNVRAVNLGDTRPSNVTVNYIVKF